VSYKYRNILLKYMSKYIYIYTYIFCFVFYFYFTCILLYLSSLFLTFCVLFLLLCVAATVTTNFPLGINKVYIYLSIYLNVFWLSFIIIMCLRVFEGLTSHGHLMIRSSLRAMKMNWRMLTEHNTSS